MSIIATLLNNADIEQQISPSITQVKQDQLSVLVIKHPTCSAALALQGAHLLFWHPTITEQPVIWLSEKALFKQDTAIRGGVPICWPWFNKLGGQPSHGFARIMTWQLIEHAESDAGVILTLQLSDSPESRKIWDHEFCLTLKVQLGETCHLELENQGHYQVTAALHSYFHIHDIETVKVSGLGEQYKESLTTTNIPAHDGELTFNQEVDRIYTNPEKTTCIHDKHRVINITHLNASDVVMWNPWQANSIAMKDMQDDSYKSMVCVETARIHRTIEPMDNIIKTIGVTVTVLNNEE